MATTAYNSKNPHLWLVAHLSDDERERRVKRADNRCKFGRGHVWFSEVDMDTNEGTDWFRCSNCGAIEYDG